MKKEKYIVASREFMADDGCEKRAVKLSVFCPIEIPGGWECRVEIQNLARSGDLVEAKSGGIDSFQALLHAMEQVAIIVYTSEPHKAGQLQWLEFGLGYGLPLLADFSNLAPSTTSPMQILHVL